MRIRWLCINHGTIFKEVSMNKWVISINNITNAKTLFDK